MTLVESDSSHAPARMNASMTPVADSHRTARADAKQCRPFSLFRALLPGDKSK
jgi:hypothetical protein